MCRYARTSTTPGQGCGTRANKYIVIIIIIIIKRQAVVPWTGIDLWLSLVGWSM
jgi:hypothetical protein